MMTPAYRALLNLSRKLTITGDPNMIERVALMVLTTYDLENDDQLDVPRDDIIGYILDMGDVEWDFTLTEMERRLMDLPVENLELTVKCGLWIRHLTSMRAFG
jgi:hypothetical protein